MSPHTISPLKFWLYTSRPLLEIAETLSDAGVINDYDCDEENVYEWFTARPGRDDLELNVSRKHNGGEIEPDEPLSFLIISRADDCPPESLVRELAARVNAALKTMVYVGTIKHLGDDDYCYTAREKISRVYER
jgi:hypothetical protein